MCVTRETFIDIIENVAYMASDDGAAVRLARQLAQSRCNVDQLVQFYGLLVGFPAPQSCCHVRFGGACKVAAHEVVYGRLERVDRDETVDVV